MATDSEVMTEKPIVYFKESMKNTGQIEELIINVALMLQQNEIFQNTLDKIIEKLESMEERLLAIEQRHFKEDGKSEIKTKILECISKYWWLICIAIISLAAEPHILNLIGALRTLFEGGK